MVLAANLWDLSLYADHKATRGADLPPELLQSWLSDAGTLFAAIRVRPCVAVKQGMQTHGDTQHQDLRKAYGRHWMWFGEKLLLSWEHKMHLRSVIYSLTAVMLQHAAVLGLP